MDNILKAFVTEVFEIIDDDRTLSELTDDETMRLSLDGLKFGYDFIIEEGHIAISKFPISIFFPLTYSGRLEIELADPQWTPQKVAQLIIDDIGGKNAV